MTRLRIMFSHAAVVLMAAACGAGAVSLALFAPLWIWALVPLGVLAQMLNEYNLHRFVFHLPPPRRQWAFDLLYRAHYGHHDFPTNHKLFFVPAWVAIPVLLLNGLGLWRYWHCLAFRRRFGSRLPSFPSGAF